MRAVWKYLLEAERGLGHQALSLPLNAQLLHVRESDSDAALWALVNPHSSTEQRRFQVLATGEQIQDSEASRLSYVGSCSMSDDGTVWHVFEIKGG